MVSFHDGYKISDLAIVFQITQETVRRYINNYQKFRTIRSKSCNTSLQAILNAVESIAIDKHQQTILTQKLKTCSIIFAQHIAFCDNVKNIVNHSNNTDVCLCVNAVHSTQCIRSSHAWFRMGYKNNEIQFTNRNILLELCLIHCGHQRTASYMILL